MSIIKKKYDVLRTELNLLSDPVVLSQAWKKAHAYIRRYNWYADVLELDVSAVNLDKLLKQWAKEVKSADYLADPLRVVPAPKNCKWHFNNGLWEPKQKNENVSGHEVPLRPLAHMPIREQVFNTAVMLCLANAVETAQGCPEIDPLEARLRGMVSYGNRLHCQWRDGDEGKNFIAEHSWGSSKCYSEYFEHYQKFLSRPVKVCQAYSAELRHDKELYVIKLDLKSFFDTVDIDALVGELKRLDVAYREKLKIQAIPNEQEERTQFWLAVERIFKWKWSVEDCKEHSLFAVDDGVGCIPLGLPQGMVSSGVLANAYLNKFDIELSKKCIAREQISFDSFIDIQLIDYCRYVDDIRLVVAVPTGSDVIDVRSLVQLFISEALNAHQIDISAAIPLVLNESKTEVQSYKSLGLGTGISSQMDAMNAGLSGTFDLDGLVETAGGLEGLLWLSEQLETEEGSDINKYKHPLEKISLPARDVRDDTVKRFVATRVVKVLREQLAMADLEAPAEDAVQLAQKVLNKHQLEHEFERAARRFIKLWATNPSLIVLLRCAFDLFPHPKLLEPVQKALLELVMFPPSPFPMFFDDTNINLKKQRVAFYVIADVLRAGSVETGYREADSYPDGSDIDGYRECLTLLAKKIIDLGLGAPWYVQQQAYLYLSTQNNTSISISDEDKPKELMAYHSLQNRLRYKNVSEKSLLKSLPLALVVQQIKRDTAMFASWLVAHLDQAQHKTKQDVGIFLATANPALLIDLLRRSKSLKDLLDDYLPTCLRLYVEEVKHKRKTQLLSSSTTLLKALVNQHNPFGNENGLLALALLLIEECVKNPAAVDFFANGLAPCDVQLKKGGHSWSDLMSLRNDFWHTDEGESLKLFESKNNGWGLYEKPEWVSEDKLWMYGLGRVLRSAFVGDIDYTTRQWLLQDEISPYSGLRSTWYQRRFGMNNSPKALLTEDQPVTPWLSGFLTALLQWPGTLMMEEVAHAVGDVSTPQQLLKIVVKRTSYLRDLYGTRSKTPFVVMPLSDAPPRLRPMRVAVVQTMRPKLAEFDTKDPLHWTPAELAAHRRHLAEMCKLTHAQVRAWIASRSYSVSDGDSEPMVDLILFPELAVHEKHLGFLRRLSDSLRATIFAGLTFVHSAKAGGVVNQGIWLLRTQRKGDGRRLVYVRQGKKFPMKSEKTMGVIGHRPDVTLVEFPLGEHGKATRVAAAICFDATDLDLVADLRERSDIFLVAALNKDIGTFDNMVSALRFHMYQPVILANSGEFGGSTAQAPYTKHDQLITHMHGGNQIAVSVFEVEPWHFNGTLSPINTKDIKSPPAGFAGR